MEIFCTIYYVLNYVKTVPQILKLIRTRSSSDYSLSMILLVITDILILMYYKKPHPAV